MTFLILGAKKFHAKSNEWSFQCYLTSPLNAGKQIDQMGDNKGTNRHNRAVYLNLHSGDPGFFEILSDFACVLNTISVL
jgi:hypothetical protein